MNWLRLVATLNLLLIGVLTAACSPGGEPAAPEDLVIPTDTPAADALLPATPTPEAPAPVVPTLPPAPTVVVETPTPVPTETPPPPPSFFVINVTADDALNVRSGPGIDNDVVAELEPGATGIEITGSGQEVEGSTWVPIRAADGAEGWVNSVFLAAAVDGDAFCGNTRARAVGDAFRAAVAAEDAAALRDLVDPQRGLRIHMHWNAPVVRIAGDGLDDIFSADVEYEWGVEPGSGLDIQGTFAEVALPRLERDLLPAGEVGCNEILHGGTPGFVVIPEVYEGINYLSFFRPDQEDSATYPFDWGTWVVGIEEWNGRYVVSFLVHYRWEP